jgi:hypothetical protein
MSQRHRRRLHDSSLRSVAPRLPRNRQPSEQRAFGPKTSANESCRCRTSTSENKLQQMVQPDWHRCESPLPIGRCEKPPWLRTILS